MVACKGRNTILALRPAFRLGKTFGAICYAVAISWGLFTAVMFCFPATATVDGSTLNYTAPVIGVAMVLATINWFVYSRKVYTGPRALHNLNSDDVAKEVATVEEEKGGLFSV